MQLFNEFMSLIGPENRLKMYIKINNKIEQWSRISYFFMVKVSLVTVFMPKLCISYTLYFTTNHGMDAFNPAFEML